MALEPARLEVEEALKAYEDCVEGEALEYGEEYERVTYMEYEAPAPDPCAEAFARLVRAVRAYEAAGGQRADLDLRGQEARVYGVLDRG
ncbi:hypothetical protein CSW23_00290 [Thermus scotoductus]|jgi:hypothetical protein|uniref:Uncharacterized protein n=1 Tax=Thermus scotoductus TaxID=37636 RepID=A0A430V718_THESC|nr:MULTISPECIES: hypothetical protein [Thermus]RTI02907.1 hypothetical protein CSW31_00680 [Thermus scotoductus]RTI20973.1 hypothetical protein CSW23_00290 [Thermus scotoductus]